MTALSLLNFDRIERREFAQTCLFFISDFVSPKRELGFVVTDHSHCCLDRKLLTACFVLKISNAWGPSNFKEIESL